MRFTSAQRRGWIRKRINGGGGAGPPPAPGVPALAASPCPFIPPPPGPGDQPGSRGGAHRAVPPPQASPCPSIRRVLAHPPHPSLPGFFLVSPPSPSWAGCSPRCDLPEQPGEGSSAGPAPVRRAPSRGLVQALQSWLCSAGGAAPTTQQRPLWCVSVDSRCTRVPGLRRSLVVCLAARLDHVDRTLTMKCTHIGKPRPLRF